MTAADALLASTDPGATAVLSDMLEEGRFHLSFTELNGAAARRRGSVMNGSRQTVLQGLWWPPIVMSVSKSSARLSDGTIMSHAHAMLLVKTKSTIGFWRWQTDLDLNPRTQTQFIVAS